MVRKLSKAPRPKARTAPKRRPRSSLPAEQERILRAATIYLIRKVGGLLVATGLRAEGDKGARRWIITVTLRYPTGFEGYVGDLRYDGKEFCFITPPEVRRERINKIAADPEGIREWNEYRASTLRAKKA